MSNERPPHDYGAKEALIFDQRGTLRLRREQYDLALDDFNKVVELAPDAFDGYWGRGLAEARKLHALIDYCRENRSVSGAIRPPANKADGAE